MTIDVQQPAPSDIVGDVVHIAGLVGGGFEGSAHLPQRAAG